MPLSHTANEHQALRVAIILCLTDYYPHKHSWYGYSPLSMTVEGRCLADGWTAMSFLLYWLSSDFLPGFKLKRYMLPVDFFYVLRRDIVTYRQGLFEWFVWLLSSSVVLKPVPYSLLFLINLHNLALLLITWLKHVLTL